MPRTSYQYGTSPRKYEPEYAPRTTRKNTTSKTTSKKKSIKNSPQQSKAKKAKERQNKTVQIFAVLFVFGMLLAVSYREIAIMELFNQKKNIETQLSTIQKENGQVEKSIREVESKLNWNEIQRTALEQGMQQKTAIPLDLEKSDNVETKRKFIKEEKNNWIENIIEYFIKK